MATRSFTTDLTLSEVEQFLSDLQDAREIYDKYEEQSASASIIFGMLGLAGAPAVIVTVAGIATGLLSSYYGTISKTITQAIDKLDYYEDFLNTHSDYDQVRMQLTVNVVNLEGKEYWIPQDFKDIAIHSTSRGWIPIS